MKSFQGRIAWVRCLDLSPDGSKLASVGDGGLVRLWDVATGRVAWKARFGHGLGASLVFSPDGAIVAASGYFQDINLCSTADGSIIAKLKSNSSYFLSAAFRPDGLALVGIAYDRLEFWDLTSREKIGRFLTSTQICSAAFSPDGSLVAVGEMNSGIRFWDPIGFPKGVSGRNLAAGSMIPDGIIPQTHLPRFLRFSPDGRLLASTIGHSAIVYDVATGRKVAALKGHRMLVYSLDFSPDGRTLASASHDGTVRFWDPETGAETACFDWEMGPVDCVRFAPDGMTVAVGGKGGIVTWDVE